MLNYRCKKRYHEFEKHDYFPFWPKTFLLQRRQIVFRSGLIFPNMRAISASLYRHPKVIVGTILISIGSLLRRKVARLPTQNTNRAIVHSIWTAGYYHWLTESLPRALCALNEHPDAEILLPSPKYQKYEESLRAIGVSSISYFPDNSNVVLPSVILTECPRWKSTTSPKLLKAVATRILRSFNLEDVSGEDIIYVSRKKSRGRYVLNEEDVLQELYDLNASRVFFEDLSFREQVHIARSAKIMISIHGAGLSNLMFMNSQCSVLELFPKRRGVLDFNLIRMSARLNSAYLRLSRAMGVNYYFLECTSDASGLRSSKMANIEVEPAKLRSQVLEILSKERFRS